MKHHSLPISMSFMLISATCIAVGSLFSLSLMQNFGVVDIVWLRVAATTLVLWGLVLVTPKIIVHPDNWQAIGYRVVFMVLAQYCFTSSLLSGSLLVSVLLFNTSPLFVPFIARLIQKHPLQRHTLIAGALSFCGMILVIYHGDGSINAWVLMGLLSGFFNACSQVTLHQASRQTHPITLNVWIYSIALLITSIPFALTYHSELTALNINWDILLLICIGIGITSAAAQILCAKAYQWVKQASNVTPGMYFSVVVSALLDWVVFHTIPTLSIWIGMLLIIGCNSFLMLKR